MENIFDWNNRRGGEGGGVWDCMEITILLEFAMEGRQLSILNEKYILCIPTDNI